MGALADLVRRAGPDYLEARRDSLSAAQRRALADIAECRTAAMGGTIVRCDACGAVRYHYHSCRNRHCPTCQDDWAQDWLVRTQARLLPCAHSLLTFTLPAELRRIARRQPRVVYAALLREAAAAVQTLAQDPQWIGGTVGILAVLHTWTRTLEYHPHAHLLVTAGGLTPDGTAWIKPAHATFLMPGYALSAVFRAKMRDALTRAGLTDAIEPRVWRRRWTVHVQSIGSGHHAALYLSRYIYRVAITDHRIHRHRDGRISFTYTHAATGETRRVTLSVERFLDRFLLHVLPRAFPKVRSYGLLSPSRRADLDRTRSLLTTHAATIATASAPPSTPRRPSPPPPPVPSPHQRHDRPDRQCPVAPMSPLSTGILSRPGNAASGSTHQSGAAVRSTRLSGSVSRRPAFTAPVNVSAKLHPDDARQASGASSRDGGSFSISRIVTARGIFNAIAAAAPPSDSV